jgi:hypothetical protein
MSQSKGALVRLAVFTLLVAIALAAGYAQLDFTSFLDW